MRIKQTHGEGSDDPCNVQASPGRPGSARTSWGGGRAGSTSRRSRPERGAGSPDLRNLGPRAVEGREWLAAPSPLPRDPGRQGPAPGGHVVVPPLPPPRPSSPGAAAPTDPRSGEEEGPRRRKPSRKRARRPRFPGEAAGGVAQPAGSRSRRHSRLHGVSARRRVGKLPGAGSPAPIPAFVSGARAREAARRRGRRAGLSGLGWQRASRHHSLARRRPPAVCRGQTWGRERGAAGDPDGEGGPGQVRRGTLSSLPLPVAGGPGQGADGGRWRPGRERGWE